MSDIRRFEHLWRQRERKLSVGSASNRLSDDGWIYVDLDQRSGPIVVADGSWLPFMSEKFEFVLMSHVLEHVHDPFNMIAEAWRVLEPGGVLLVVVPHALSWSYIIPPQHMRPLVPDSFRYFLPETYETAGHGYLAFERRPIRPWSIEKVEVTPSLRFAWLAKHAPSLVQLLGEHLFGVYQDVYCVMRKMTA